MLGCFLTALVVLLGITLLFIVCAAPLLLLVALGIGLIWLVGWLLIYHTILGVILVIAIILVELI